MKPQGHGERGQVQRDFGGEKTGHRGADTQHGKGKECQVLFAEIGQKENGEEGQEAGDFPDGLQESDFLPGEGGPLDHKVVQQGKPAVQTDRHGTGHQDQHAFRAFEEPGEEAVQHYSGHGMTPGPGSRPGGSYRTGMVGEGSPAGPAVDRVPIGPIAAITRDTAANPGLADWIHSSGFLRVRFMGEVRGIPETWLVPKEGLEPSRREAQPPQDCVSTSSTTSATGWSSSMFSTRPVLREHRILRLVLPRLPHRELPGHPR